MSRPNISASKSRKRQRKDHPPSWLENESLAVVVAPDGNPLRTKVASSNDKELFLDRLEKEIARPYRRHHESNGDSTSKIKQRRKKPLPPPHRIDATEEAAAVEKKNELLGRVWKQRIVLGTNQCTNILENIMCNNSRDRQVSLVPSLIVLARDVYPCTILSHVPVMARQIEMRQQCDGGEEKSSSRVPILLLPGKASQEMGKIFGTKRMSIALFLPANKKDDEGTMGADEKQLHESIDSFVKFVKKTLL